MTAGPTRYQFADLIAAFGSMEEPRRVHAAPAAPRGTPTFGMRHKGANELSGRPPAFMFAGKPPVDMHAAAMRSPYSFDEVEAALASIPDGYVGHALGNRLPWMKAVVWPLVIYAARHPEIATQVRSSFDHQNRRIADPDRVAKFADDYFASALSEFDRELKRERNGKSRPQGIRIDRLIQGALGNVDGCAWGGRWDGRTAVHAQAGTILTPSANSNTPTSTAAVSAPADSSTAPFFQSVHFDAANLRPVDWVIPNLLIRGDITVLASQGGGAKTAWAVHLVVAAAAGRQRLGPFIVHTRPGGLRVAFISAEEDPNRFALLVAAACNLLVLTQTERAAVTTNLMLHDARSSGWRLGEHRPNSRDEIPQEADDQGLTQLKDALKADRPDMLVLDTLAALFALQSEIDNMAVTAHMSRLARVVGVARCAVLLLHHTPKMTREAAAVQRGEATLVRGGGAITNSARVVATITALPAVEAAQFAMQGLKPEAVRRLEHAKINDRPPMDPTYFVLKSVLVKVRDGSEHEVRAVEFISPPPSGGGGISAALRNVAMKAIDSGARDAHGAKVPLSPGGGRTNDRSAIQYIAQAVMHATPGLAETHAKTAARDLLKDLRDRIGCVIEQEVQIQRYKRDGHPDGTRKSRGLVCRWDLAPWATRSPTHPVATDQPVLEASGANLGSKPVPSIQSPNSGGDTSVIVELK